MVVSKSIMVMEIVVEESVFVCVCVHAIISLFVPVLTGWLFIYLINVYFHPSQEDKPFPKLGVPGLDRDQSL